MIKEELRIQLITTMLKVPATETFGGRTTLLSGISHRGLNRNENNSQQDFELLIDQLMPLRRGEDNKCYLLILIENAIERASGMTLANDLQVLLEQWDKIIETIQFDEGQLVGVHRDTIMMDRKDEIRLYRQMLNRQVSKRVLLIKGGPKMGKSQLMREFRRIAQQERQFPCALVDIRTRGQSYRDVLKLIVQEVGYSYFRRYEEKAGQLSSRSATPAVPQGDLATMIALFAASQSQAAQSSGDQRDQLTQAFLEDLRLMPPASPVILLLDAFEEANEETRLWIYRELIIGLYRLPNVLTVVAGRELPEPESTWQEASITTELTRVTVEDYKAYCSDMGATELTEDNIQLFYRGFDGRPGDFAEVVQNFIPRGVK